MRKIFVICLFIIFISLKAVSVHAVESYHTCKNLFSDKKYRQSSNCFYTRLNSNPQDVQSRFWYAASLYFDRQYQKSYEQYIYIANKYPYTSIGRYSKAEAQKVESRIKNITNAKLNDTGDYILELDKVTKWKSMPVKVWIQPCMYTPTARKAFYEWQSKTNGAVRFSMVQNKNAAQIKVYFVDKLSTTTCADNLGITVLRYHGNRNINARIEILKKTKSNQPASSRQLYAVVLHEAGHAIGLNGHSKRNNDIMFPNDFTNDVHLSQRDINTVRAIYKK